MAGAVQRLAAKVPQLIKGTQQATLPRLKTFWKYAKVEMRPPAPSELGQVVQGFSNLVNAAKTQKFRYVTVKEAAINTLVTAEVIFWFYIGECIGKGSLVGYQIPGAVDYQVHM